MWATRPETATVTTPNPAGKALQARLADQANKKASRPSNLNQPKIPALRTGIARRSASGQLTPAPTSGQPASEEGNQLQPG